MYQIEKSSDRNMLANQVFKSKSVLPPMYIESKNVSDDSVYEEQLTSHKFHIPNHRKSLKHYEKQANSIYQNSQTHQEKEPTELKVTNYIKYFDIIIWALFFISSLKTRNDNRIFFMIIDCIASTFAIIRTIFQVTKFHKINFADVIYIGNFLITLAIYLQVVEPLYTILLSLRTLRIFLAVIVVESLYKTLNIIIKAIKGVWKIGLCILVICLIYCLIAIQFYKGDLQYRCRVSDIPQDRYWQTDNQIYLCGSRKCSNGYYCESTYKYDLQRNQNEFQSEKILYGYVNFNSIYNSFFAIFHLIVGIGWSEIVFIHSDYYTKYISYIFFVSFIIIGPLIMMNILVGLLYEEYIRLKEKQQTNTKSTSKKSNAMKVSVLAKKLEQKKEKDSHSIQLKSKQSTEIKYQIRSPLFTLENLKKFFFHTIILIQIITTCLDQYNLNQISNRNNGITLGVCFVFYSCEILSMLYFFIRQGLEKQKNIYLRFLDIFIYIVNFCNYLLKIIQGKYIFQQSTILSPFSQSLICIRFIIVLEQNIIDTSLPILLKSFYQTIKQLVPFLGIIFVICLTGGALSMEIYQNNLKMIGQTILPSDQLQKGVSPLINFDNYLNSWISFTSFLLNEQWHVTMYRLIRANNSIIIIYFVVIIFLFTFIFIKLFVAVYINTYLEILKKTNIFKDEIVDKTVMSDKIAIALKQNSLFIFDANNFFRKFSVNLIESTYYKYFFLIFLCVYSILLIASDQLNSQTAHIVYSSLDFIFILDMIINILAFKMFGDYSYTKDGTNIIDLIINIAVVANLFTSQFRMFIRAIRACRIIIVTQIFTELKIIIVSIYKSLLDLMRLILLLLTFLLFFSSLSLKYLKGSTYSCSQSLYTTKLQCMDYGANWINNLGIGFDNIIQSMFNIFSVITSEGWLNIMQVAIQSKGQDISISKNQTNYWWGIFFLPVFFIGNLIFINIFVGVLIQKVQNISNAYDQFEVSIKNLPKHHQEWARIKNYIFKIKPQKSCKRPLDWKKYLFDALESEQYKYFTKFIVLLNICIFSCFYHRQSLQFFHFLTVMNQICYFIFFMQFIIQIYVYGSQRRYLYFDMIIIIITIPGMLSIFFPVNFLNLQSNSIVTQLIIFMNALQITRCYKIFTEFKIISTTFNNILSILPRVTSVFAMFFIFLFIFAILGQDLFQNIMFNNSVTERTINFNTFFDSIFALFKIMTGELWFQNAIDLSRELQFGYFCGISNQTHNQCGSKFNLIFFVVFFLLLGIIFLNLLIATILMLTVQSLNLEKSATRRYKLNNFLQLWKKYDEDGQGFINYKIFFQFSMIMAMEYGIDKSQFHKISKKKMFMKILNIPVYQNIQTKQYCYLIYDVGICMSRAALLLREPQSFDFLLNQNSETLTSLKNMPNSKKFVLTNMNSGNMSTIILMMEKLRKWKKKALSQGSCTDINKFFGN